MSEISGARTPDALLAHSGWVRGVARALVLDESRVDDVVQETWLAAIERPPGGDVRDERSWLGGVLRNVVRKGRRGDSRRRRRELGGEPPDPLPSAGDLVERAELAQRVARAVLELEEPYRSTLLLRFFEELTPEEIARREGAPSSTVRNRLRRGLDLVRRRFDAESDGERRSWALAMLPLALPPRGAAIAVTAAGTAATGGLAMTSKALIALALVGTAGITGAYLAWPDGEETSSTVEASAPGELDTPTAAPRETERTALEATSDAAVPDVSGSASGFEIAGRVTDTSGAPVAGAMVFVGGRDGFPVNDADQRALRLSTGGDLPPHREYEGARDDIAYGRHVETDVDGRYSIRFEGPRRAYVCLAATPGIHKDSGQCGWHDAPASGVDFTATLVPTAGLRISVVDQASGDRLPAFRGWIAGPGDEERIEFHATEGTSEHTFELLGAGATVTVAVIDPPWAASEQEAILTSGAIDDLVLRADGGAGVRGIVSDDSGAALESAFVFWGEITRMRHRGSPLSKYDPALVTDGVWTDAAGAFVLPGNGEMVSAWHALASPATVRVDELGEIALPPRSSVTGRILDADGSPLANQGLAVDQTHEALTDADGRFRIENLEAGAHGVRLRERRFFGVQLVAGETFDTGDLELLTDFTATAFSAGAPWSDEFSGVGVSTGRVFQVIEFGLREGSFQRERFAPGRYALIGEARIGILQADGSNGTIDMGDADLTIRAVPGTRVFVVPEAENDAVLFYGQFQRIEIDAEGANTYALPRGRYRVGIDGKGVVTIVDVTGPGAEVTLD